MQALDDRTADRGKTRFPSDLTDAEWALVAPLIPPARPGGRRRSIDMRNVVDGILFVLTTRCRWSAAPKEFPSKSTLYHYFDLWTYEGVLDRIHQVLFAEGQCDEAAVYGDKPGRPLPTSQDPMSARRARARHELAWTKRQSPSADADGL